MKSTTFQMNFLALTMAFQAARAAMDIDSHVSEQLQTWNGVGLTAWSVDDQANVCQLGVAGERILGSGQPLRTTGDSRHHVGSVTKSMTASLLAILVHQEFFPTSGWDTTLADCIPEAVNGTYSNVTLRQIVSNSAGMADFPPDDTVYPAFDPNNMTSFRSAVAVAAVQSTPVFPPGTSYSYSNWAFVVAGHIIEKVTNMTWEEALAVYLFEPLGIDLGPDDPSSYVGAPNNDVDPWGHAHRTPCDPSAADCDNPRVLGPAGTFSGPVAAMATYFAWHLACHNGKHTTLLSQEACQEIHQPLDEQLLIPGTGWSYGYGWICHDENEDLGRICTHNGSNRLNYYNVTLVFSQNRAFVSYTNAAQDPEFSNIRMGNEMVGIMLPDFQSNNSTMGDSCTSPFETSFSIADPTASPTAPIKTTEAPTSSGNFYSIGILSLLSAIVLLSHM